MIVSEIKRHILTKKKMPQKDIINTQFEGKVVFTNKIGSAVSKCEWEYSNKK